MDLITVRIEFAESPALDKILQSCERLRSAVELFAGAVPFAAAPGRPFPFELDDQAAPVQAAPAAPAAQAVQTAPAAPAAPAAQAVQAAPAPAAAAGGANRGARQVSQAEPAAEQGGAANSQTGAPAEQGGAASSAEPHTLDDVRQICAALRADFPAHFSPAEGREFTHRALKLAGLGTFKDLQPEEVEKLYRACVKLDAEFRAAQGGAA